MPKLYLIAQGSHLKYLILKYRLFSKVNISSRKGSMSRLAIKVCDGGTGEESKESMSIKVRLCKTNYFYPLFMEVPIGANLHME